MNPSFSGHVTSCKFIQGRADLVIFATRAPDRHDEFNTVLARVSLNGGPAYALSAIVDFVTRYATVSIVVTNPEWGASGTGYTPCDAIALTALE